jgi:hypothetical protein
LAAAITELAAWRAAYSALSGGAQSYSIGNRTLTRTDATTVLERIDYLERKILKLERNGAIRVQRVVPRDL